MLNKAEFYFYKISPVYFVNRGPVSKRLRVKVRFTSESNWQTLWCGKQVFEVAPLVHIYLSDIHASGLLKFRDENGLTYELQTKEVSNE